MFSKGPDENEKAARANGTPTSLEKRQNGRVILTTGGRTPTAGLGRWTTKIEGGARVPRRRGGLRGAGQRIGDWRLAQPSKSVRGVLHPARRHQGSVQKSGSCAQSDAALRALASQPLNGAGDAAEAEAAARSSG